VLRSFVNSGERGISIQLSAKILEINTRRINGGHLAAAEKRQKSQRVEKQTKSTAKTYWDEKEIVKEV